MTSDKIESFLLWLDDQENIKSWTDYRLANEAGINPSVLSRARSGTLPKWDACVSIAQALHISPITVFRKAGLLPPGPDDKINLEDWKHLLEQMTESEREEIWRIGLMKVEMRQEREERGKVAVCMLFLSGMRADALASAPISCIDIQERVIHQLPNHGVRTKNRKAAITYLLHIPPLLEVVMHWDQRVKKFSPRALWYATLSNDGMALTATEVAALGRTSTIEDDVRLICERANLPYQAPHKLRHGHIMYARSLARTPEEIKAVSQNAMHANSIITDQVYGKLTGNNVRSLIANLKPDDDKPDKAEILRLIELLTQQLT